MSEDSNLRQFVEWLLTEMRDGLLAAMDPILARSYGADWKENRVKELVTRNKPETNRNEFSLEDVSVVYDLLLSTWTTDLEPCQWGRYIRVHTRFFKSLRNAWAHYDPISDGELLDGLNRGVLVLKQLGDHQRARLLEDQIEIIRNAKNDNQGQLAFPDGFEAEPEVVNALPQDETTDTEQLKGSSVWQRLNGRQRTLVRQPRLKSGYRRIKGSAGSGKTIVLVARAIWCAACEDKKVLLIAYNKTMVAYLKDMLRACAHEADAMECMRNIDCMHYHQWCLGALADLGIQKPMPPQNGDTGAWNTYNRSLGIVAEKAITQNTNNQFLHYDVILVDEGQDFHLEWWQSLRAAVKEGEDGDGNALGQMMLAADATQDLYETASAWTEEAMSGAGFRGKWYVLEASYRMPPGLIPLVSIFVDDFIRKNSEINRPTSSDADAADFPFDWKWINIDESNELEHLVAETKRLMELVGNRKFVIQLPSKKGKSALQALLSAGIEPTHIFNQRGENSKESFELVRGSPGLITAHSFKGCEAPFVIAWLDQFTRPDKRNAAYVALTRLQRHSEGSQLVVLNAAPELASLPRRWESFESDYTGDKGDIF